MMDDLTGFQRDLLVVTAGLDDPNGLDVKDELENYYESPINHGRLYPNLDTLVDRGFVQKEPLDKRTNVYRLTDDGYQALAERRAWENRVAGRTGTGTDEESLLAD
jgi:DNA-binding PadR family transcriptional regulator